VPSAAADRLPELRARIRERSPLSPEKTEWVISGRYGAIPNRLAHALERWPLEQSSVLDVGCSFGHCLAHFGPGSLGVDNVAEHVDFCRAIGLDAVRVDVDEGLAAVPDGAFDVVWIFDILEHLDAPRLLLRDVRPKLRSGGLLLLYLGLLPRSRLLRGAFRRRGIVPFESDVHYYQFTLDTARYLVERAGYRIEEIGVPFLRGRLRTLEPLVLRQTPTAIVAARSDPGREAALAEAESRNKPDSAGSS
jgi:SAM-dependent methyltransferase